MPAAAVADGCCSTPEIDPDEKELVFSLDASLQHPHAGLCAQQPQLQHQKRKQMAAMAAATQPQTELINEAPKAAKQADEGEQKDIRQHQKHKQHKKEKERSSDKKSKKRSGEGTDDQHASKKYRRTIEESEQKTPQQQKPDGLSNGLPAPAAAASAPQASTPAAISSRKDRKHHNADQHRDSLQKHRSSHKKDKHKSKHKKEKRKSKRKSRKDN